MKEQKKNQVSELFYECNLVRKVTISNICQDLSTAPGKIVENNVFRTGLKTFFYHLEILSWDRSRVLILKNRFYCFSLFFHIFVDDVVAYQRYLNGTYKYFFDICDGSSLCLITLSLFLCFYKENWEHMGQLISYSKNTRHM